MPETFPITKPEPGEEVAVLWRHVRRLANAVEDLQRTIRDLDARLPRRRPMDIRPGGLRWRGTYDSTATYAVDDEVAVVGDGQGTWICQVAHGPGPADDHAPWLGEDDGTTQYWALLPGSAAAMWV